MINFGKVGFLTGTTVDDHSVTFSSEIRRQARTRQATAWNRGAATAAIAAAMRSAPVDNDIAGILRRMQPRCQRYRGGIPPPSCSSTWSATSSRTNSSGLLAAWSTHSMLATSTETLRPGSSTRRQSEMPSASTRNISASNVGCARHSSATSSHSGPACQQQRHGGVKIEEARHHGCSRVRAAAQSVCFKKGCAAYDCVLLDVSLEPAQQRLQGLVRRGDGGCVLPALRGADAQRAAERR